MDIHSNTFSQHRGDIPPYFVRIRIDTLIPKLKLSTMGFEPMPHNCGSELESDALDHSAMLTLKKIL